MKKFDIAVLGGGPGGYVAAIKGSQLGKSVCLIEKEKLGGVCLNWGCIPTKVLLKNAGILNQINSSHKYGINVENVSFDFKLNIKRSRDIASRLSKGIEFLIKKNNIAHIDGFGKLTSEKEILIEKDGSVEKIHAENIIIATGARPKKIPGLILDGKRVISSKNALELKIVPKKIVIIGSGAIGCEFAYYYNSFGSEVHMIEISDRILPLEDIEVSKELEKSFNNKGIKTSTSTKVLKAEALKSKVKILIENKGTQKYLESEIALVAIGVTGNIENIGLNKVGVRTSPGKIDINDMNQTNVPNIFAIGDVSGAPWLAHRASSQAHVAVGHMLGKSVRKLENLLIPGCTYCEPQVASLGLTEENAIKEGYQIKVGRSFFKSSGKALALGNTEGFIKLIFDEQYGELIGAHIIGSDATELIGELVMAKNLEATIEDLAYTIHAHPTLSESIMEAALDALGIPVHH